jgi:ABC-type dipeptide/oligopeptide/nickel transport system ATPase component
VPAHTPATTPSSVHVGSGPGSTGDPLLAVDSLSVEFGTDYGTVHAVRDVSWYLQSGETLAILGESGSGKSVSAQAVMGILDMPPGRITSGPSASAAPTC